MLIEYAPIEGTRGVQSLMTVGDVELGSRLKEISPLKAGIGVFLLATVLSLRSAILLGVAAAAARKYLIK